MFATRMSYLARLGVRLRRRLVKWKLGTCGSWRGILQTVMAPGADGIKETVPSGLTLPCGNSWSKAAMAMTRGTDTFDVTWIPVELPRSRSHSFIEDLDFLLKLPSINPRHLGSNEVIGSDSSGIW